MARNIRVVDSPGYLGSNFTRPDIEVMEIDGRGPYIDGRGPYRRRWTGREPLALILILALVSIWMYQRSEGGFFGRTFSIGAPSTGSAPPAEIETVPVFPPAAPVVEPAPPIEGPPLVTTEPRPIIAAGQQSDVIGYSRVMAERLNLRARPGFESGVIAVLPMYSDLAILRQLHVNPNGDVWVEVMAETDYGWQKGWVMRQYIESCNCPMT